MRCPFPEEKNSLNESVRGPLRRQIVLLRNLEKPLPMLADGSVVGPKLGNEECSLQGMSLAVRMLEFLRER